MTQVSIILPTFNRRRFLPEAFEAICQQTFKDWELIVVDDGSTDDTRDLVEAFASQRPGQVRYIHQPNSGVSAARNRGLDEARCPFIAFFDSDDLWLPHHLMDLHQALQENPDVNWVFGAGRHLNMITGQIILEDSFRPKGVARPFLSLACKTQGRLKVIIDEKAIMRTIMDNQFGGLQASMFRREVFDRCRFPDARIGEDYALAVRYLATGQRQGYLDNVHVLYRIHDEQTSTAAGDRIALEKRIARQQAYAAVIGEMLKLPELKPEHRRKLRERYADEIFWKLGYHLQWCHGYTAQAMKSMRRAVLASAGNVRLWRSYSRFWFLRLTGQAPRLPVNSPRLDGQ